MYCGSRHWLSRVLCPPIFPQYPLVSLPPPPLQPHTLLPFPDLMFPAGAFQLTPLPGIDPRAVVRIDGVYLAGLDLHQLVTHVKQTAEAHLSRVYATFPGLQVRGPAGRGQRFRPAVLP